MACAYKSSLLPLCVQRAFAAFLRYLRPLLWTEGACPSFPALYPSQPPQRNGSRVLLFLDLRLSRLNLLVNLFGVIFDIHFPVNLLRRRFLSGGHGDDVRGELVHVTRELA